MLKNKTVYKTIYLQNIDFFFTSIDCSFSNKIKDKKLSYTILQRIICSVETDFGQLQFARGLGFGGCILLWDFWWRTGTGKRRW